MKEFIQKTVIIFIMLTLFSYIFAANFIPKYEFSFISNDCLRGNKFTGKVEYYSNQNGRWMDK